VHTASTPSDCMVAAAVADSCQQVPPLLTSPASVDCVSITHQLADALPERAQRALWYDPPLWEDVDPVPCGQAPGSGGHNRLLHSRATHHWQGLAVHKKLPAVRNVWGSPEGGSTGQWGPTAMRTGAEAAYARLAAAAPSTAAPGQHHLRGLVTHAIGP
jgi:hypothetical protein